MSKTDFRDKKLPDEQGTIVTAEIMDRLNNQVPTGEDFDGSAPLLFGEDTFGENAYRVSFAFGKKTAEGFNTSMVANKLVDSSATFITNGVQVGDVVLNVTWKTSTKVTAVDSETQLSLETHIFFESWNAYAVGPHVFQAPQERTAVTAGMEITFRSTYTNTGPCTLEVNALGPVQIHKNYNQDLSAGDIKAGQMVKVVYDGNYFQLASTPSEIPVRDSARGLVVKVNATNPAYQVDISAEEIILHDANGGAYRAISVNETVDVTWTGIGGLDAGSEEPNTTYYLWVIYDPEYHIISGLLSTSRTSPTMPLGQTHKALVGAVFNNSNSDFDGVYTWDYLESMSKLAVSNWTERSNPKNVQLRSVVWNGSLFVAVGSEDGTDAYIVTSPNGITWTERSNPKNSTLNGIAWNGFLFVAVGSAETAGPDAYIVTSPNGITWTERSNPKVFTLYGVAWNGSLFAAVGSNDGADAYIVTSPDGITWTERSNPTSNYLYDITWNGSLFVAVGVESGGTDAYIVTSPDGITWTERSNPKMVSLKGIAWNGALFAAVGSADGTDAYIVTSPDGITWTERSNPKNLDLESVAWNGALFVATGDADGTDAYMVTSPDGISWTERSNPKSNHLLDITWDGSFFVAVGVNDGTDAYIVTSLGI